MALLTIGLLALMFLAMPQAMAKFSGQHKFVNGSNVDCTKCHQDVESEFTGPGNSVHNGTVDCKDCHIGLQVGGNRIKWSDAYGYTFLGGDPQDYYKNIDFHGAALVECLWCHVNNSLTGTVKTNVLEEFNNSNSVEAHRPLFWRAENASGVDTLDMLKGANEACIACHTHAANVTIIEPTRYLNITANYTECTENVDANCYGGWGINFSITQ